VRSIASLEEKIKEAQTGETLWLGTTTTKYGQMFYKAQDVTYGDDTLRYTAKDAWSGPRKTSSFAYGFADLAAAIRDYNEQRYVKFLRSNITAAKLYIKQQEEVLRNWAPRPLKPVE